jgi:hypothetical protein
MKVKVLCLGRAAKEIEIGESTTVEQAISQAGFPKDSSYTRHVNGSPAFDSAIHRHPDKACNAICIAGFKPKFRSRGRPYSGHDLSEKRRVEAERTSAARSARLGAAHAFRPCNR